MGHLARRWGLHRIQVDLMAAYRHDSQTVADTDYVNARREHGGCELVWLDAHKDPDVLSRESILSHGNDPVSPLWNHVTAQLRT